MKRKSRTWIFVVFVLLTILPYGIALVFAGKGYHFVGFLLNPSDGNSYLAKMMEGYRGDWLFTLPYTAETGAGHVLFLFYLALGQLARIIHLPLPWVYHLARLLGLIWMGWALGRYFRKTLGETVTADRAWLLALFGSGLGWLVILFGGTSMDTWVAEAYPFLAGYTNPHFPISIAILLELLILADHNRRLDWLWAAAGSLALAILQPFGVPLLLAILAGVELIHFLQRQPVQWKVITAAAVGGLPMLAYQAWITLQDPLLKGWNSQNVTPAPAAWDILVSFSPALLLAGYGLYQITRRKMQVHPQLLVWAVVGLVFLVIPFNLQRRFLLGYYIPIAGLAAAGLAAWQALRPKAVNFRWVLLVSLPTNLLVLAIGMFGVASHSPRLYLTQDELAGFQWLQAQTPDQVIIAAAPDTGLFIPGQTGRRVFYGHPFETVNAAAEKTWLETILAQPQAADMYGQLAARGAAFLFWGPREQALAPPGVQPDLPVVFKSNTVRIYSLQP